MAEKVRSRLWFVLLYPDNESHVAALEIIRKEYNYVGICHDKDTWAEGESPDHAAGELKKKHYHIILKFTQARWNTALASELGIDTRFLEQCRNFDNAAVYLVHDGLDDKYQYDASELEGSLVPAVMKLLAAQDEDSRVLELMKLIKSMGYIEYSDLVVKACEQGMYSDLRRMGYILSRIVDAHNDVLEKERLKRIRDQNDRERFDGFEAGPFSDKWPFGKNKGF